MLVHLSGRNAIFLLQRDVEVSLVVSEIEVDLTAIVKYEAFAVPVSVRTASFALMAMFLLRRSHGPCIDVHVWVDLDRGHFETDGLEQQAGRGCCRDKLVAIEPSLATTYL
jgi:hypothetical protein